MDLNGVLFLSVCFSFALFCQINIYLFFERKNNASCCAIASAEKNLKPDGKESSVIFFYIEVNGGQIQTHVYLLVSVLLFV